mmetsp:Transcript_4201/g.10640  ORF Transcript_4201/g.10640 Transcript_4201/m.10640 type:complete len:260 (+) Transcript_4201:387-1166(+)
MPEVTQRPRIGAVEELDPVVVVSRHDALRAAGNPGRNPDRAGGSNEDDGGPRTRGPTVLNHLLGRQHGRRRLALPVDRIATDHNVSLRGSKRAVAVNHKERQQPHQRVHRRGGVRGRRQRRWQRRVGHVGPSRVPDKGDPQPTTPVPPEIPLFVQHGIWQHRVQERGPRGAVLEGRRPDPHCLPDGLDQKIHKGECVGEEEEEVPPRHVGDQVSQACCRIDLYPTAKEEVALKFGRSDDGVNGPVVHPSRGHRVASAEQ